MVQCVASILCSSCHPCCGPLEQSAHHLRWHMQHSATASLSWTLKSYLPQTQDIWPHDQMFCHSNDQLRSANPYDNSILPVVTCTGYFRASEPLTRQDGDYGIAHPCFPVSSLSPFCLISHDFHTCQTFISHYFLSSYTWFPSLHNMNVELPTEWSLPAEPTSSSDSLQANAMEWVRANIFHQSWLIIYRALGLGQGHQSSFTIFNGPGHSFIVQQVRDFNKSRKRSATLFI